MLLNSNAVNFTENSLASIVTCGKVETIIVPVWVRKVFDRNRLDYIDILKYDVVRRILSVEDVAELLFLNMGETKNPLGKFKGYGFPLQDAWVKTMCTDNQSEYNNVILPLATTAMIESRVNERLKNTGSTEVSDVIDDPLLKVDGKHLDVQPYRFQILQGNIVLIFIEQGIFDTLMVRDQAFKMVSEYLKALYSLVPIREVSKYYSAFELYFNLL